MELWEDPGRFPWISNPPHWPFHRPSLEVTALHLTIAQCPSSRRPRVPRPPDLWLRRPGVTHISRRGRGTSIRRTNGGKHLGNRREMLDGWMDSQWMDGWMDGFRWVLHKKKVEVAFFICPDIMMNWWFSLVPSKAQKSWSCWFPWFHESRHIYPRENP